MTLGMTITTILETLAVVFVLWAVLNEDRFVRFERRLFAKIRRSRLKVIEGGRQDVSTFVGER